MSTEPTPGDGLLPSVTHRYVSRPNAEMNLVGWLLFALLLVLLLPLLPFIAVAWLVSKLADVAR